MYCLGKQDIMGSSLQTKRKHLSHASVSVSSVVTEWQLGICAAIFSACLMAETKQWVTHRNIWFGDDFCLWVTVVRLSFLEDRVSNQFLKWIPRTEIFFLFFKSTTFNCYFSFVGWLFYNCWNSWVERCFVIPAVASSENFSRMIWFVKIVSKHSEESF